MPRREFTKAVKVEIIRRATDAKGVIRCEQCGCVPRTFHIDHTIADGLSVDKSKPLTADDGKLLCAGSKDTCHGIKTAKEDVPAIAKAKRREARHAGIKGRPTPLAGRSRDEIDAGKRARSESVRTQGKLGLPPRRDIYGSAQ